MLLTNLFFVEGLITIIDSALGYVFLLIATLVAMTHFLRFH
jgi:hypothetical protein